MAKHLSKRHIPFHHDDRRRTPHNLLQPGGSGWPGSEAKGFQTIQVFQTGWDMAIQARHGSTLARVGGIRTRVPGVTETDSPIMFHLIPSLILRDFSVS